MTKTQYLVVRCKCGNTFVSARSAPAHSADVINVNVAVCDDCDDDCWELLTELWPLAQEQTGTAAD